MRSCPIPSIGAPSDSERCDAVSSTTSASSVRYTEMPWLDRDVRVMAHSGVVAGGAKNGKLQLQAVVLGILLQVIIDLFNT